MFQILFVIVAACQFVQDEEKTTYYNTPVLTNSDWVDVDSEAWCALSLRNGDSWTSGTAWMLACDVDSVYAPYTALKGTYRFYAPGDDQEDLLILKLAFKRHYEGEADGNDIDWKLQTWRFEPIGIEIEIPLDANNTVPNHKLALSIVRAYFVDSQGREIQKRYKPSTLGDHIFGTSEKSVRRLPFADIGDTLTMKKDSSFLGQQKMEDCPPPGFRVR